MIANKKVERAIKLFEFLKAYHTLKTPLIYELNQCEWFTKIELDKDKNEEEKSPQKAMDLLYVDHSQKELFEELYDIYIRMKKEPEAIELVWGDLHLYQEGNCVIDHPLLVNTVFMEFNLEKEIFTIKRSDKGTELQENLLGVIDHADEQLIVETIKSFNQKPFSVLDDVWNEAFMDYLKEATVKSPLRIVRQSSLFLRKRQIGFQTALDEIIEDLYEKKDVPGFIADIVGYGDQVRKNQRVKDNFKKLSADTNGIDQKVLFTKPANTEQLLVAKQLERNEAVLVQGPPGTGKTHTIANILGHLLSEGKSVLVTSYSEKALSVIKEQVAKELQALCISLLGDAQSRKELETSLDAIHTKRATLERGELSRRVTTHEKNREVCVRTLEKLKTELKAIKLSEYTPLRVAGKMYKPAEAAKYVNTHRESCEWLKGPVRTGAGLPLGKNELKELYELAMTFNSEEQLICNWVMDLDELIQPEVFATLVEEDEKGKKHGVPSWYDYIDKDKMTRDTTHLKAVITELELIAKTLQVEQPWAKEVLFSGVDEKSKEKWQSLAVNIKEVYQLGQTYADEMITYKPEVTLVEASLKPLDVYSQINQKLQGGGKLSKLTLWLNPNMKKVIASSKVNGKHPETMQEFEVLIHHMVLEEKRQQLKQRWNRQMQPLGAKSAEELGEAFEVECQKYGDMILRYLEWYKKKWLPLSKRLETCGINLSKANEFCDLTSLKYGEIDYIQQMVVPSVLEVLQYQIYELNKELSHATKYTIVEAINQYPEGNQSDVLMGIKRTLKSNKVDEYKAYYEQVIEAKTKYHQIKQCEELLEKMEFAAPGWVEAFKEEQKTQTLMYHENVEEAWLYRQLTEMILKRNERTVEHVKEEMRDIEKRLTYYTKQLAQDKAWLHKLIEFDSNRTQVQAIEAWKQLIMKIGAGKGRQVEMLKVEARKLMPKCQKAVPVWIMPLNKVAEHFDPRENKFDVVIIDEASQADMLALNALYLGKQVLIVGDHEQVSPLAIGERSEDMERLIKTYIPEVPHNYLYSGRFSIYDLAQVSGYQPVKLKEHFRCVPEIIGYSNQLAYNGQIEPLREGGGRALQPAIHMNKVSGAEEVDQINEAEANFIVEQIVACCKDKQYAKKTFGVISLKGDKQADYIDQLLQKRMTITAYNERRILCGNPSHFQGDERDVIFISFVEAPPVDEKARLIGYGTDNLYKKRYNVAMSRAKDQVWLIHSFNPDTQLKEDDIRKVLFTYCENIGKENNGEEKLYEEPLTLFEEEIKAYLEAEGLQVVAHKKDGTLEIGLVVSKGNKKVRVVCDSEKWKEESELEEEMTKQIILERIGWSFIYVGATTFYADEHNELQKLIDQVKEKLEV